MYIQLEDMRMYYEVTGEGSPVILLHGNGEDHTIFDETAELLSKTHRVYLPDSRCHGKSERTEEISYELMRDDMIGFIKRLHITEPVFCGFSDGGIIGLMTAIKEPNLLSSLIAGGANLNPKGLRIIPMLPYRIPALFGDRLCRMMFTQPDIRAEELKRIRIPVHIIAGERDVVRKKHTMMIASSIQNSTLDIMQGENHGSYIVHSTKLHDIIMRYISFDQTRSESLL